MRNEYLHYLFSFLRLILSASISKAMRDSFIFYLKILLNLSTSDVEHSWYYCAVIKAPLCMFKHRLPFLLLHRSNVRIVQHLYLFPLSLFTIQLFL